MSDLVPVIEFDLGPGLRMEARIDAAETDAITERWEFGHWMLTHVPEGGKKLPDGFLASLAAATGKSERELKYRRQFAEQFPTREALGTAVPNYKSWTEIREQALPDSASAGAEIAAPREEEAEDQPKEAEPTRDELISAALAPLAPADREQAMAEASHFHGDTPTPAQVREIVAPYLWPDERQRNLRSKLAAGHAIVVNQRSDSDLIKWASDRGLFAKVDRNTPWGNPFEMPADGDRDTVIAAYAEHYLPHKPSLLSKVHDLRGKALGCWCAPERCHADILAGRTNHAA